MIALRHGRIALALHPLRPAASGSAARPLLLLHGRGERTPARPPARVTGWPGPIFGLDFTGHGASTVPRGGGYSAEVLMGDADAALAHLGETTLVGRGLGAWVALLLAGARPREVRGAVLCDGPGLAGGGPRPVTPSIARAAEQRAGAPDPYALVELARDVRPPDYATSFVRQASQLSGLERPLAVCAVERPDWLAAVVEEPCVQMATLAEALALYESIPIHHRPA